ncbi:MAG: hypothetical protein LBS04_01305 [Tannerellaceae bacterium]|jgi:hypothetical protein|nr:hypothetical protein [Tannerellaceae bacterium]
MNNSKLNVQSCDIANPPLLYYTPQTKIQEESDGFYPLYDDEKQIIYNMRTVGTKCLRTSTTSKKLPGGSTNYSSDKKNEIDDSKYVK